MATHTLSENTRKTTLTISGSETIIFPTKLNWFGVRSLDGADILASKLAAPTQLADGVYSTDEGDGDIIIDDGSHQFVHQMTSLFAFMDSVKPDGIYVLEDLHTSLSWGSDAKNTPLYFLTFFDNVDCISTEKQGVLRERIKDVTVYNRKNPLGSCNKRSVTSIITFNQPGQ